MEPALVTLVTVVAVALVVVEVVESLVAVVEVVVQSRGGVSSVDSGGGVVSGATCVVSCDGVV